MPVKLSITLRLLALGSQLLEQEKPPVTAGLMASDQEQPGLVIWWLPDDCASLAFWGKEAFAAVKC